MRTPDADCLEAGHLYRVLAGVVHEGRGVVWKTMRCDRCGRLFSRAVPPMPPVAGERMNTA